MGYFSEPADSKDRSAATRPIGPWPFSHLRIVPPPLSGGSPHSLAKSLTLSGRPLHQILAQLLQLSACHRRRYLETPTLINFRFFDVRDKGRHVPQGFLVDDRITALIEPGDHPIGLCIILSCV
jgi:hypothetical protein